MAGAARGQAAGESSKAAAPAVDVLIFTNGDQLSGKLLRGVHDTVVYHSDMAGDITVPLDKVKELRTTGEFAVLKHGAPVKESRAVKPTQIAITSDGVVTSPGKGATQPSIAIKDVAYIVDGPEFEKSLAKEAGFLEGWNGTVNLGATLVQATQHGGTFTGGFGFVRQIPVLTYFRARNKTSLNFQETYGTLTTPVIPQTVPATPDSVVKTSIFHGDAERDEYFSKKGYYLGNASFDHNFAQGLELQQLYGAGVGYTPFSTPVHQLDLKVDVHYEKQEFTNPVGNLNLIGSTFSENYRRALPLKVTLTEAASVLPAWNDLNAYSANGSLGLALPLFKRLSVNLNAADSFINNPSPGFQKNSVTFSSGLSYSIR